MCWGLFLIKFSSGLLQELPFTLTLMILFFFRQNLKKFHDFSSNFIINVFLKKVKCRVMFTEAYLEPSQTSTMELFCKNNWRFVAINYLCTNASSYVYVWLGSKYASCSLEEPCKMAPLNSFILQYYVRTSFIICFRK